MQALRFEQTGSFDDLTLRTVARPSLIPGEALVRVKAAGINGLTVTITFDTTDGNLLCYPLRISPIFTRQSDAAAVLGSLPFVTLPRTPGRDFSGEVMEALDDAGAPANAWIGVHVWGTGSDRGFTSDGTFAEFVKVPLSALSRKPETLSHIEAASMTLPWLCAWITVDRLANVKGGDNIVIIGAHGSIGSAAARLCKDRGARIFGTYTSIANVTPPPYLTPVELVSDTAIRDVIAKEGLLNKIDVLLDCAGYERPFNDALFTMTPNGSGRVVVMAAHAKDGTFPINLRTFYTKALTLKGMKSSILDSTEIKAFLDLLAENIDSGVFQGPRAVTTVDMKDKLAVTGALKETLTRSFHVRSVIVP